MLIRDSIVLVYDIEIFPNVFHCVVKDTETQKIFKLEISERRNDIGKIIALFYRIRNNKTPLGTKYIFCGYNNIHYDNPIINYIIANREELIQLPDFEICQRLDKLSQEIIHSKEGFQSWHKWKYLVFFETLDLLTMLFSQKLRVGLKEMQVTMQYHNVQEYEGDFSKYLPASKIDEMVA